MATALADGLIMPAMLAELTLKSGVVRVWSGVGDLVWDSKTWSGIGLLGSVGAITEASAVQAEGTTVTLSGIGLSPLDIPALGVTPPDPPFAPPAGQSLAWSIPTIPSDASPTVISVNSGSGSANAHGGGLIGNYGSSFETSLVLSWGGFLLPPEIPPDATITAIYPVLVAESASPNFIATLYDDLSPIFSAPGTSIPSAVYYGHFHSTLRGLSLGASLERSLFPHGPPAPPFSDTLGVSFVGAAVYYIGTPLTKTSMLYEAMNDIRLGGAAKIWFGLMSEGAFLGAPYLVFSGSVDKPTVKPSPNGSTIELALENRMVNLQRATNRKYTAADQHLFFPDDLFFNWVEILQDISLKEGQA